MLHLHTDATEKAGGKKKRWKNLEVNYYPEHPNPRMTQGNATVFIKVDGMGFIQRGCVGQ